MANTLAKLKPQLYQFCSTFIDKRLKIIRQNIALIQEGLQSETKSSAGDKHETGRAQLQLEREKLGVQWAELEQMQQVLAKVDPEVQRETIGLGSLVQTTAATYYIAISAGQCILASQTVYCISINTPIGSKLAGKSEGDTVYFKDTTIHIQQVF